MRGAFSSPIGPGRDRMSTDTRPYEVDAFVRTVADRALQDVLKSVDAAISRANRDRPTNPAPANARDRFVGALGGLRFFLGTGIRPPGLDDETFRQFQPVVESLVRRGALNPKSLFAFPAESSETPG